MTHSIEEARREVLMAGTFRRAPQEWAGRMVREAEGQQTVADFEVLFRRVGLCEADARIAARGLHQGLYATFEDAVQSRLMWDHQKHNNVRSDLVAEVAKTLPPRTKLEEGLQEQEGQS